MQTHTNKIFIYSKPQTKERLNEIQKRRNLYQKLVFWQNIEKHSNFARIYFFRSTEMINLFLYYMTTTIMLLIAN